MSTDYYRFRAPITSVRGEVRGGHTHVGIWINHAKAGEIVVRNEEYPELLRAIKGDIVVAHAHYGGDGVGPLIAARFPIEDGEWLICEYGKLHQWRELCQECTLEEDRT